MIIAVVRFSKKTCGPIGIACVVTDPGTKNGASTRRDTRVWAGQSSNYGCLIPDESTIETWRSGRRQLGVTRRVDDTEGIARSRQLSCRPVKIEECSGKLRRERIGAILDTGCHQFDLHTIGRLKVNCQATHDLAGIAIVVAGTRKTALPGTAGHTFHRKSRRHIFSQRTADKTAGFEAIEALERGIRSSMEFPGRFADNVVDCTAGRALAEQSALRAFENFNPFYVEIKRVGHDWNVTRYLV